MDNIKGSGEDATSGSGSFNRGFEAWSYYAAEGETEAEVGSVRWLIEDVRARGLVGQRKVDGV